MKKIKKFEEYESFIQSVTDEKKPVQFIERFSQYSGDGKVFEDKGDALIVDPEYVRTFPNSKEAVEYIDDIVEKLMNRHSGKEYKIGKTANYNNRACFQDYVDQSYSYMYPVVKDPSRTFIEEVEGLCNDKHNKRVNCGNDRGGSGGDMADKKKAFEGNFYVYIVIG